MNLISILNKSGLNKDEIVYLLSLTENEDIEKLFAQADEVRNEFCGNEIHLRGIIEISNNCEQDCLYCGLRISNFELQRYRMNKEEILETAEQITNAGIKTIVLQSGEDFEYECDFISDLIKTIKNNFDAAITLSLGERGFFEYDEWFKAGADRYLLKHETGNDILYYKLHNKQKLEERLLHLRYLKAIGFQTGSGNIIDIPGQTLEDIAEDILLCKELDCDMASFSPFISSEQTPFKKYPDADLNLTLKTMAAARIVLKDVHIPTTTALNTLVKNGRELGLKAGANVIMPNFTPETYRSKYLIYNKKDISEFDIVHTLADIKNVVSSLGLKISDGYGHSLKLKTEEEKAS
jgi:biotin synthase